MDQLTRVAITSRVFALSAILGLTLVLENAAALQVTLVVAVVAAIAAYLSTVSPVPPHWIIAVEGVLTSFVVMLALPDSVLILPYLVALPLLAGLARGVLGAAAVIVFQLTAMLALTLTASGLPGFEERGELLAPWSLTIAGAGLAGTWAHKFRRKTLDTQSMETYESARRLLGQLRTLARRLTSGLDPAAVATEILDTVHGLTGDRHSAVFVRTEGGVFAPLAYLGEGANHGLDHNDPLLAECWRTGRPATDVSNGNGTWAPGRAALPLRVGGGMVGVLLSRGFAATSAQLTDLQHRLDELSVRLDTALAFDEVRTLVTADERQRLAREIHDGVAQELASLGYMVDEMTQLTSEPDVVHSLKQFRGELSRVITELRLSIFDLRTEVGSSAGLGSALSDYVRTVGARSDITVHLTLDESPTRLTPGVETELFRIAQEAITNARKHSRAGNLWVDCAVDPPSARIQVRDDGQGLGRGRGDSYGLKIMQERADRIGARLEIAGSFSEHSAGTCVTVSIGSGQDPPSENGDQP